MQDKIKNKKNEILNKKFKKNLKAGYDTYEVDIFFDSIITFLTYIDNEIINLQNSNSKLSNINNELIGTIKQQKKMILSLENELNELKDNGYQNQKIIKDISLLQNNVEKIKNGNK